MIAGALGGRLYITSDGGSSWSETQPQGNADLNWYTTSMSTDGTKLIAGVDGGGLYLNDEPLPVEFTSFTESTNGSEVDLTWKTATEINNYGFEVQRLQDCRITRLQNWEKIGFVEGHGNSNSPKQYSFIDSNPGNSKVEYRLKQIDNNGTFKYSKIIDVALSTPTKFALEQNYPNPFNPSTTIQYDIPKEEHVALKVYNILGQEVETLVDKEQQAGSYSAVKKLVLLK